MSSSDKVCLITQDFYPLKGGIASYLLAVYEKYFSDVKFEVIIPESLGTKEEFGNLPFKVHTTKFAPFSFKNSEREECNKDILNILKSIKPKLVLFGYIRSHPEVGLMYKQLNPYSKVAIFTHAKEVFIDNCIVSRTNINGSHKGYSLEEGEFYKDILNSVDVIFAVSNFTKRLLQRQGINSQVIVLKPPVKKMKPVGRDLARGELGISKDSQVLLSVGRLIKRKGQEKVIEIIPILKKRYPNVRYLIVGNGPELENISGLIKNLGIQEQVNLFTSVENKDLNLFYAACDIFVLPCDFIEPNDAEGRGIVFLEASSFGKACIGGNSGGVSEAVIDNVTGLLVDPKSEEDLLKKITLLLENSELREKLGSNGSKVVSKDFSTSKSDYLARLFNIH